MGWKALPLSWARARWSTLFPYRIMCRRPRSNWIVIGRGASWYSPICSDEMKCGVWRVQCEVWGVKSAVWSVKCGVWRKQWEVWSVEFEVWSVECEECSVKCEVWSVKSGVWSVKSGKCEGAKWSFKCDMWNRTPLSQSAHTHGLGWRTARASSIDEKGLIYIFKATSAPPRAGTTGKSTS